MITLLADHSVVAGVSESAFRDVIWISDLEKEPFFWECQFCAVDLKLDSFTNKPQSLSWMCLVSPGNAHNPGKRGKKLPAFRLF